MLAEEQERILSAIAREDMRRAQRIEKELIAVGLNGTGIAMLPLQAEPAPLPESPEVVALIEDMASRPRLFLTPPYVPPDGPATPQRANQIAWLNRRLERARYREELRFRMRGGDQPEPAAGMFALMDLHHQCCRFPVDAAPFLFCGATCAGERSYCDEHHALCHRAPWERR
jgi:hypothetical protein